MKSHLLVATIIACVFVACSPKPQSDDQGSNRFQAILADHWNWLLESNPTFATSLGVRDFDENLSDPSLGAYDKDIETAKGFLEQLSNIAVNEMGEDDQLNARLLKLDLENQIAASEFGGKYIILTNRRGPHTQMTGLPSRLPFINAADYKLSLIHI